MIPQLRDASHRAMLGAWLAATAAFVASLGDFGELWTANAARPEFGLADPPPWLITPATLAGALAIPLYALGYLVRADSVRAVAPRRALVVAVAGTAFAVLGGTVHAVTGVLIQSGTAPIATGLDPLNGILASGPAVLALWGAGAAAFLVASGAEASLPQSRRERATGPLALTLLITLAGSMLPLPWKDLVAPAALNLAHIVFFATIPRRR